LIYSFQNDAGVFFQFPAFSSFEKYPGNQIGIQKNNFPEKTISISVIGSFYGLVQQHGDILRR